MKMALPCFLWGASFTNVNPPIFGRSISALRCVSWSSIIVISFSRASFDNSSALVDWKPSQLNDIISVTLSAREQRVPVPGRLKWGTSQVDVSPCVAPYTCLPSVYNRLFANSAFCHRICFDHVHDAWRVPCSRGSRSFCDFPFELHFIVVV